MIPGINVTDEQAFSRWLGGYIDNYVKTNMKQDQANNTTQDLRNRGLEDGLSNGNVPVWNNGSWAPSKIASPGFTQLWPTATAPAGWQLCDGTALSRTLFRPLFDVIGTTWGVGDGSTTYNVPDIRSRVPIGAGTGVGLTARTLAATGGEENHQLSIAELATHNHTITDPGHTHDGTTFFGGTTNVANRVSGQNTAGGTPTTSPMNPMVTSNTTSISINNNGSGTAHNNMQPFLVFNFIIKL